MSPAEQFIQALAGDAAAPCTFQTFDDSPDKRREFIGQMHGTHDDCADRLAQLNAHGAGVFITVNATDGQGRKAENITQVRALFVDFDVENAQRDFDTLGLSPSVIVESSPGKHHCYWLADGWPLEQFSDAQKMLAAAFGSDPVVNDLSRVMRLPGYMHRKGEPFMVRIIGGNWKRYSEQDLAAWLVGLPPQRSLPPAASPAPQRAKGDTYAEKAFSNALRSVLSAPDGERNNTLNGAAYGLARLAGAGRLDWQQCRKALHSAACGAGLSDGEIDGTLNSAERGLTQPTYEGVPQQSSPSAFEWLALPDEHKAPQDVPGIQVEPISSLEFQTARLTPRVILEQYLYADVRTRVAAGGVGKTTLLLHEAVTLALGRPLWGITPYEPIKTAIVTREDSREILVARMREITYSMCLTPDEVEQVLNRVIVLDLSGIPFRLCKVEGDVVLPHQENVSELLRALEGFAPDWLIFDPLVSFGVGESRVNDAEQGLIEVFRVIRNRLNCCVEGIHHSGKANSREKNLDQYAGRGGSALADGSRMVAVMQPLTPGEWKKETGLSLGPNESGVVLALPKLSYAKPQPPLYIRRYGYSFTDVRVSKQTPTEEAAERAERLLSFVVGEFQQGRLYAKSDLENITDQLGMSRAEIRAAITRLKVEGHLIYNEVKGKSGSHFEPVTFAENDGDTLPQGDEAIAA